MFPSFFARSWDIVTVTVSEDRCPHAVALFEPQFEAKGVSAGLFPEGCFPRYCIAIKNSRYY